MYLVRRATTPNGYPIVDGGAKSRLGRCFYDLAAQGERYSLISVEYRKFRGEVAVEMYGRGVVVRKLDQDTQLLLRSGDAEQAHGSRPFPGIRAFGDPNEVQFYVGSVAVLVGVDVKRSGDAREIAFDVFYFIGRSAYGRDQERKLTYLLVHGGGECIVGIGCYHCIRHRGE